MKAVAEEKKVFGVIPAKYAPYVVGVAFLFLGYEFYDNVLSSPAPTNYAPARVAKSTTPGISSIGSDVAPPPRPAASRARGDEFHPALRPKRAEDRIDVSKIDPTLRLDMLAKLQKVPPAGGRDLFNWGQPPAPPAALHTGPEPVVKIAPPAPVTPLQPLGPAQPPPPPPITLKYYGLGTTLRDGRKTAFFMDGEEILLETEGATFNTRYRLVSIGANSAVVEDIPNKRQQTLPLAEDAPGAGSVGD